MEGIWSFERRSVSARADGSVVPKLMGNRLTIPGLIAREVIQNSEDASAQLQMEEGKYIDFRVEINFIELIGEDKTKAIASLELKKLMLRATQVGLEEIGIEKGYDASVSSKDDPIGFLVISDFGARGLTGALPLLEASAYYNALLAIGITADKADGAGGSYGFGKSAFVIGSRIKTVFAHTRMAATDDDSVTRRFGGVAYLKGYKHQKESFTGTAHFGNKETDKLEWLHLPFEDDDADELGALIKMPIRSDAIEELGTSLAIPFPTVSPEELIEAVEEYWWPAIEGILPKMSIAITDYKGNRVVLASKKHDKYKSFRRAYELASSALEPDTTYEFKKEIKDDQGNTLGTFAGVADEDTCFLPVLPGHDARFARSSRIGLTRKPRMIVQYLDFGKGQSGAPFIEGIFVSAPDDNVVENALRDCEPATHDYWWPTASSELTAWKKSHLAEAKVVIPIKDGIKAAVSEFREKIKPIPVKQEAMLKDFGKLLGRLLKNSGDGPVPQNPQPLSIQFVDGPKPFFQDSEICYTSTVSIGITDDAPKQLYTMNIDWEYRIVADEDGKGDLVDFKKEIVEGSAGFKDKNHVFKGEYVTLRFVSDPVPSSFSVRAIPKVKITPVDRGEKKS